MSQERIEEIKNECIIEAKDMYILDGNGPIGVSSFVNRDQRY